MPGGASEDFRFELDLSLATVISTYREEDVKSCESVMLVTETFTSEVTFHNLSGLLETWQVFQCVKASRKLLLHKAHPSSKC